MRFTSCWVRANLSALGLLALLENNSLARTLAQPSMTVVSGQTASFMAGGEFPIPIAQSLGQVTITYKPYGIRLAFTPTVFSKERIAIKLAPEVSELDFTNAVTSSGVSVPAILTRRAETTIELGDGESFVIAGLISRNFNDAVDKVPGLGDLPVLGAFFKSTRFSREDKELVIIVTPTLVRPLAAKAELPQLPGAEYDQYNPSWMKRLFYGGVAPDDEIGRTFQISQKEQDTMDNRFVLVTARQEQFNWLSESLTGIGVIIWDKGDNKDSLIELIGSIGVRVVFLDFNPDATAAFCRHGRGVAQGVSQPVAGRCRQAGFGRQHPHCDACRRARIH